ncbi:MAG: biotin carboxylase N-terminal domain-containing protein, partial [Pseudomonadales bacterium]
MRVLVANRGEIALRVLRACQEMDIETVVAYSKADGHQHYLNLADDTVCISASSYLDIPTIVSAAKTHRCDAVHPGYGMLAENPTFAGSLEDNGITLVGPCSEHIALMGDKVSARQAARDLGLNTIPGSSEKVCDLQ